jgi:biopolymer transport protein TolQ
MKTDLSILNLVLHASVVVQFVMLLLLGLSLWSWVTVFKKWSQLKSARDKSAAFEQAFWSGTDLNSLYQKVQQANVEKSGEKSPIASPTARIYEAGMQAYLKSRQSRPDDSAVWLDVARRAMQAAQSRELEALDKGLPFLASVGSVSPYIGLFGTVWGIMNSFRGLANVQQSTLANVAPGIAEALVATAIGLFAAIPATVAYNRYAADVDSMAGRFDTFIDEFLNILQRQAR